MSEQHRSFDAVVIGAGFAGLYMLHRLRGLGLSARVFEAGEGIGGTWFWNRYPGARCDVESLEYSYSFSDELEQEWRWSERYPAQAEVLRYLEHVADRFDLRKDIKLATRVTAAHFDEPSRRWIITTDRGDRVAAKYCITAVGCLSAANIPRFPGLESFAGLLLHTTRWPAEGVSFAGKRVGVIGTGSTAVQLIPEVAREAAHLFVFQRTPTFSVPAWNKPLDDETQRQEKARYREIRRAARASRFGTASMRTAEIPAAQLSEADRQKELQARWDQGGLNLIGAFPQALVVPENNAAIAEFIRAKIRETVHDPEVAAKLSPTSYPVGCKRLSVNTGYYETFNRSNVTLVDVSAAPIEAITPKGVRTRDQEYDLDVLVLATGFDAITGALHNIDIRGRGGATLKEKWAGGPRTYLGLATAGFPNLFIITGPLSPSVLTNMVTSIEQHVEWIADLVAHMEREEIALVAPTAEAEDAWVAHTATVAGSTLFSAKGCASWYWGSNIPGKPRVFGVYIGGVGLYGARIQEVAQKGYEGFTLE